MIENIPFYIPFVFVLTTFLTLLLFYGASHQSKQVMAIFTTWLLIQGIAGYSGFYLVTNTLPPRFALLVGPMLITIIIFFLTSRGREMMDTLDVKWLTYLHVVRIPVEIVLLWLFIQGQVPQVMTFEGRNFDILAGLTAPLIAYYGYTRNKLGKVILIFWNVICIALLLNIVVHAALSAPFPFQQLAFDQPNVAVLYFPFVWLPGFIVPVVMFSHLVCLRRLIKG